MNRPAPTPSCSVRPPLTRCSAASSATSAASDAVCWMTPPPGAVRAEPRGQAEQVDEPVEDVRLELGRGRRGRPQHALHAEPGGEQVAEDRRPARVRREVGEERRVLPVRDARQHDLVQVAQHVRERLAGLGRRVRQRRADLARRDLARAPGRLDALLVVGDPVDDLPSVRAELVGRHVRHPRDLTVRTSARSARPSARPTPGARSRCCSAGCIATRRRPGRGRRP